jgi:hypothetical protein
MRVEGWPVTTPAEASLDCNRPPLQKSGLGGRTLTAEA